ncbi:MFS transporter [Pseudomonas sp. NCCP-436]|uniref:MFS transporter n=1 Tax=Pseudomonas sp. NCCP-436 TaxID=2842481 RepID=UPI001C81DA96|nr:MFS transporter [Pseudomonas sp. NCCP-436]GIZ10756.1 EmrB/QacA family drug resistance transporter [Pseudomonas sp. NCCP-436]
MNPTTYAIAISSLGAVAGTTFSVMTILTIGDIAGGLSVSADQISWFNTLFNVGAICGLPIVMTMAASLGRGRAMAIAGLCYVLGSVAVALSPSYEWALVARFLHGFFSGMLPVLMMLMVMTSLFPGKGQLEGMTLFALATSIGTGVAASIGGYLVSELSWRWLFWVQVVVGVVYTLLACRALPGELGNLDYLRTKDWLSYFFLTAGLGGLMVVMAEGERRFWLETWWIPGLLLGSLVGLAYGAHSLWKAERPLLVLRIFKKPTFTWAIILSLIFRFGTLLSVWIAPQYLMRMQGFKAGDIGDLLLVMVPAVLAGFPLAYWLVKRFDSRLVLSAGLCLFALAAALCGELSADWSTDQLRLPIILVGVGQALISVALLRYAVFGVGKEEGPSCGIIFNLARLYALLGGLGGLWHLVTEREKYHYARIAESLAVTDPTVIRQLSQQAMSLAPFTTDSAAAQGAALGALYLEANQQAYTLAYGDAFLLTALVMLIGAIFVWALPGLPEAIAAAPSPQQSGNEPHR